MRITDYLITPADIWNGARSLGVYRIFGLVGVTVAAFMAGNYGISGQLILLGWLAVIVLVLGIDARMPLTLALVLLLGIAALSVFDPSSSSDRTGSPQELMAVGVFYCLVFAVIALLRDEVLEGRVSRKTRWSPRRAKRGSNQPAETTRTTVPQPYLTPPVGQQLRLGGLFPKPTLGDSIARKQPSAAPTAHGIEHQAASPGATTKRHAAITSRLEASGMRPREVQLKHGVALRRDSTEVGRKRGMLVSDIQPIHTPSQHRTRSAVSRSAPLVNTRLIDDVRGRPEGVPLLQPTNDRTLRRERPNG